MTWLRAYWRNVALALIAVALLQLSYQKGLDAGMASGQIEPTWRYRFYVAPIILSQLYYGRPYDYVGYQKLAIPFHAPTPSIDELFGTLKAVENVESEGLFFIVADDKGIIDFARLAFELYGLRTASLYDMYFTILFVSCVLFVCGYFTDRHKLAMLVFLCLGLYITMPVFVAYPPGFNVLDTHAFAVLSLVAALHVLLSATEANPTRRALLITTVAQALIMTLVYHARSSSITQTLGIAAAYPIILYVTRAGGPSYRRRFIPLVILLVALALLPIYQRIQYHPDYFGRRSTLSHVVYHNLLIGLQWNPTLQKRYGLDNGDLGAAKAVEAFMTASGNPPRTWKAIDLNSVTTQQPFNFVDYEEAARALYLSIWRGDPKEVLLTLVYWHPNDVYNAFKVHAGFGNLPPDFDRQSTYNPIRPIQLGVLLVTVALCSAGGTPLKPVYALIALSMLASSLVVPIAFYGGGFIILVEAFVVAGLLSYATLAVLMSRAFGRWWRRFSPPAPSFEPRSA